MEIFIQPYQEQYQSRVLDLILNIQQNEFNISITADEQPDLKNIPDFYQKNQGNFWLAVHENQVIGTLALLDIDNNQGALRKMFVDKRYRGTKLAAAKKLLTTLLNWSKAKGVQEVYLGTTPQFLAAHRFYEKNNFQEIATAELPEKFPVMAVDKKFYKYSV